MSIRVIWLMCVIAAFLFPSAITTAAAGCHYVNPPGAGNAYCWGDCADGPPPENETQVCKKPILQGGCVCTGIGITPIIRFPHPPKNADVAFSLTRVDLGWDPSYWAVNSVFAATKEAWPEIEIDNQGLWGFGTTDVVPEASEAGILYQVRATSDPTVRQVEISSISVEIPSFYHSYWAPAPTGTNYLTTDPDYKSIGTINTQTGEFHARIYTRLLNDHYSMSDNLVWLIDLNGWIDSESGMLVAGMSVLGFQDGASFADLD